jgi:sec-independent protein translocase protein TatC
MQLLPRRLRHGEEATLVEHLGELRGRLVVSLIALVAGFSVAFAFHVRIIEWLNGPLPDRFKPTTLGVAEPFLTSIVISLWAGFVLAFPVVLWQVWSFLAPAFREQTQRILVGFVVFASLLLAGGLIFGYYVALPASVHFLTNYDNSLYDTQIRAKDYYSFVLLVLAAVGVVFELPIFVLALVRIGVLSTAKLRRNRRIGYVIVAALAVALPGIDPVTTLMEMGPLIVLYELSIWLSVLFERRWKAREEAREAAFEAGDF